MDSESTEAEILASISGQLYYNIINLICFAVLYGVFLAATSIALKLLLDAKPHSTRRIILLLVTSIILIINTIDFLDTFEPLLILSKKTLIASLSGGLPEQSLLAQASIITWVEISSWASTVELCISDLLVVWRAIAIWDGNQLIKWALIALMVINGVTNFAQAILSDVSSVNPIRTRQINAASIYISLATNAIATGLIALKLWKYRRSVRTVLGRYKSTPMQKLLLLLVESGAIFLILQLTMAMLDVEDIGSQPNSFQLAYTILEEIFEEACCLYPVAVVIMINFQSSLVDATAHSEEPAAQEFTEDTENDHTSMTRRWRAVSSSVELGELGRS
ncbi:hypothetical protein DFJ43DRAFT_1079733 [Lentinula guzmanii]|uniref:Uncharacterized protein n=1 Tax=Lentinula guzmanii TaxID=2804957 RepID=A0AA38J8L3_9AGAR|nr:hypothetical protein DFJ43DRAFT_1079733 [Lentinula guzmanii]